MGALHPGHISLVQTAYEITNHVVVSIFVNPNQFNKTKDLELYPRDIYGDIEMLANSHCHTLYIPSVVDVYPPAYVQPYYNLGQSENRLEGSSRPGHFQGVAAVLERLFIDITPEKVFLGEKDFQQVTVVQKLVELKNLPVEVVSCATLREEDGLAMSSRNRRLPLALRPAAKHIYQQMQKASSAKTVQELQQQLEVCIAFLKSQPHFEVEYFEAANVNSFESLTNQPSFSREQWRIFAAVNVGGVRLIDNCALLPE